MDKTNELTNPPAFPWASSSDNGAIGQAGFNKGMSLRDYFAARALTLSEERLSSSSPFKADHPYYGLTMAQVVAKEAYEYADAMLAERLKPTTNV